MRRGAEVASALRAVGQRLRDWCKALDLDLADAHFYGGLALAGAGAWLLSPAWALIGVGVALAVNGFLAARAGG